MGIRWVSLRFLMPQWWSGGASDWRLERAPGGLPGPRCRFTSFLARKARHREHRVGLGTREAAGFIPGEEPEGFISIYVAAPDEVCSGAVIDLGPSFRIMTVSAKLLWRKFCQENVTECPSADVAAWISRGGAGSRTAIWPVEQGAGHSHRPRPSRSSSNWNSGADAGGRPRYCIAGWRRGFARACRPPLPPRPFGSQFRRCVRAADAGASKHSNPGPKLRLFVITPSPTVTAEKRRGGEGRRARGTREWDAKALCGSTTRMPAAVARSQSFLKG